MVFHVGDVQNLLIAAKQKVALGDKVVKLEEDIANLNSAINALQKTVDELEIKNSLNKNAANTYLQQIAVMQAQRTELEKVVVEYRKLLQQQRRKTRMTAVLGVILSGLTFYLGTR